MASRPDFAWAELTIDCRDPARVSRFWSELLDEPAKGPRDGWFRIEPLVPGGPLVNFQPVPEEKTGKNRVHIDLWVGDIDAAVAFAEELGATKIEVHTSPYAIDVVMADPEGNEFCVVALPPQGAARP